MTSNLGAIRRNIDLANITRVQSLKSSMDRFPMMREKPQAKKLIVKRERFALKWSDLEKQFPQLAEMSIRQQTTFLSERFDLSVPLTIDKVKKLRSKGVVHIIKSHDLSPLTIEQRATVSRLWNTLIERVEYKNKAHDIEPLDEDQKTFRLKRGNSNTWEKVSGSKVRGFDNAKMISHNGEIKLGGFHRTYIVMEDTGRIVHNGIVKKTLIKRFFSRDDIGFRKLSAKTNARVPTVSLYDILQDLSLVLVDCVRKGIEDEKVLARYLISCGANLFRDFCKGEANRIYQVWDLDNVTIDAAGYAELHDAIDEE